MIKPNLTYRNRIDFMDIGKFIAITFVVLIHVLQRTLGGFTGNDGWGSILFLMLGVPPFFFFSGMSYRLKGPLNPLAFVYDLVKRALMYMLPFVYFILLRIWFYDVYPDFSKGWDDVMQYPVNGLWVCWILFWITAVVDLGLLISYFFPKLKILFVSFMLIIGFVVLMILRNKNVIVVNHDIGYDYFIIYIPTFLVAYLLGPYILKIDNLIISIICFVAGLSALFPIAIYNHDFITVNFLEKSQWMLYLASFCSVLAYFGLINIVKKWKFSKILAFCGQFTMEMYFLHLVLLRNWTRKDFATYDNGIIFLVTLGLFLLCYVNTFAVIAVCYFVPFLHFVMFGRHYSMYEFENNIFGKIKYFFFEYGQIPAIERLWL